MKYPLTQGVDPVITEAQQAARDAVAAIRKALDAYEKAGFGGHVVLPMRGALSQADYSLFEVLS